MEMEMCRFKLTLSSLTKTCKRGIEEQNSFGKTKLKLKKIFINLSTNNI